MNVLLQEYASTAFAVGATAVLMLVQLVVADVVGLRRGHTPGSPVATDHNDLLFRATRTVGNVNESIAIFLAAVIVCVLNGASPALTSYAAWFYVSARLAYAACYYLDLRTARSVSFGVSLLALLALIVIGLGS